MKRVSTLLLLIIISVSTLVARDKIRVACVGNSITFGATIKNRAQDSYPAQLQQMLGEEYEVKNFGVSARTALSKGNFPYIDTPQYKESQSFNPDIVLIKLGTNDSKPGNFAHIDEFEGDYRAIVDTYKSLPSSPRIILITPLKCFFTAADKKSISNERLVKSITPIIQKIAHECDVEIINGYPLCGTDYVKSVMPDKLHPSAVGAKMMAKHFCDVITAKRDDKFSAFDKLEGGKIFNFYGYRGYEYSNDGVQYRVVEPHKPNKEHKWVWRARFWGHEPQLDQRLLEMGYHVAYCDVAGLFGSDEAVERWDSFYAMMKGCGLNKRVVLEGMSRGGLIVYNWAVHNTKKVEAIYADAPVMDVKSWPMGAKRSSKEVAQMCKAYGLSTEEMLTFDRNPLDHAEVIAKAKIPIIHVVGAVDDVVPVSENTAKFVELLRSYGHEITVISKSGVGHHPHSLKDPKVIADFIMAE